MAAEFTSLEKVLIASTTILAVSDVGFLTFIGYLLEVKRSPDDPSPCITPTCISAASNLFFHMNLSANPCDDFYNYACGQFLQDTNIGDEDTSVSTFTTLTDELDDNLRVALLRDYKEQAPKYEKLLKMYYRSCMDLDAIQHDNMVPMFRLINKFGGWPMINKTWNGSCCDLGYTMGELKKIGVRGLFRFSIDVDPDDSKVKVPSLAQPQLAFPKYYYMSPKFANMIEALRDYLKETAQLLSRNSIKAEKLDKDVKEVIDFEISLAKILIPLPMRVFQMQTNDTAIYLKKTFGKKLDFELFFERLFHPSISKGFEPLGITDLAFFDNLGPLIKKTSKRTIFNYIMWKLIGSFSIVMPHEFRDIEAKFQSVATGTKETLPRWISCIQEMKMRLFVPLGALYVKHYFGPSAKNKLLDFIKELLSSQRTLIKGVNWLHEDTKNLAFEKLDVMRNIVAYPDYYDLEDPFHDVYLEANLEVSDFLELNVLVEDVRMRYKIVKIREPVDYKKSEMEIAIVDAFYSSEMNLMVFPAGILQFPFFSDGVPAYLNFGGIGYAIGHEVTHGFDNYGKQYDKDGNSRNWWKKEDEEMFKRASRCFVQQYGSFVVPELNDTVNGELTLSENIADNGGVRGAFMAYRNWVKKNGEELKLAGIFLNPEQLFFLNVGRVHCSKTRPEMEASNLRTDPHAPSRFRVNGVLMNMDEFSEVYNCPLGSPMNPKKKCRVW